MMTVDEIYSAIADNITSVIKEDWQSSELNLEVLEGMVSNTGTYINTSGQDKQLDVEEFDFQLTFDILDLHRLTTAGGNISWNRAIFTLSADGKFNMEFIWDQALHDQVEKLS
jgi:YezG-like immunity protein